MYPLLTDDADAITEAMDKAHLPVTRFGYPQWPAMDASAYPVAGQLARQVLAFPCHQELNAAELAQLIDGVRGIVMANARRAA
jgi:dTDP-4-amino-4,6-dideoxygalactose transaminase